MTHYKVIMVREDDLSSLPSTSKAYAEKAIGIGKTRFRYWINTGHVKLDSDGKVPFAEIIRLRRK